MKWGRSLYKNIQSFLYFQLTINVAACLIALFGPVLGVDMPFTVTQFLWVNLVMDTLAALCLASEPADPIVLLDKPRKSGEFILNKLLKKSILGLGLTMFVIMSLVILDIKNGSTWFHLDKTEFFAIFMTINWWNLFNARVIGKNRSVFHDLFKNSKFVIGSLVILAGTILIVQIGGDVFETRPLSFNEWVIIILASSPIMIVREIWFRLFNKNQKK
jgi:Ca2+-transporting ATPase